MGVREPWGDSGLHPRRGEEISECHSAVLAGDKP